MKLIWCSDIHLNFLGRDDKELFYQDLKDADGDNILITGDIAESPNIAPILAAMHDYTGKKIYFVAGNHDYYEGSIVKDRARFKKFKFAHYLPKRSYVKLDKHTALVGQDGWGDCRNGDYEESQKGLNKFTMADWLYIKELNKAYLKYDADVLKLALQKIADKDAERMCRSVTRALMDKNIKRVIIASHVPPLEEACLHAGRKSSPYGLCFFSSKIFELVIIPIVEKHPEVDFLWLSGHTHSSVTVEKRPNLTVRVAKSEYYYPQIESIIEDDWH